MSSEPKIFKTPFAQATPLRFDVPDASPGTPETAGRASYDVGFPSATMIPIASGGTPPHGQDMNGVLYDVTANLLYLQRGNAYRFSQRVAGAGGYPKGALVKPDDAATPGFFLSVIDANASDPNTAQLGPQWIFLSFVGRYSAGLRYPVDAIVVHGDYAWQAARENGTGTATGVVQPGQNSAVWKTFGNAEGSYEKLPNTLCLRNDDGRTQVEAPAHRDDAIPMWWAEERYGGGGGAGNAVATPAITSPASGALLESLEFSVGVSPIALTGGGTPIASQTRVRVLDEDRLTILVDLLIGYSTSVRITAPESVIGKTIYLVAQHEDAVQGWSPFSAQVGVSITSVALRKVAVISPVSGSANIPLGALTVNVADGAWSDASAFAGSQSRIVVRDLSSGAAVYDSGWLSYRTSFTVPAGTLSPAASYWIGAQHQAASAPASNPDAELTSPAVLANDPEAGRFVTMASSAPNTGALQHNIPSTVLQGTQTQVKIWGAIATDGGDVSYKIPQNAIAGGLSFSKYSGIAENETITMYAPTIVNTTANASLQIVAASSFGAKAAPLSVPVTILGQTEWVFTSDTAWACPFDGLADIWAGGGGGGGSFIAWYSSDTNIYGEEGFRGGGGGGGGCGKSRISLNRQTYQILVGQGGVGGERATATATNGGDSSFQGIVVGYGGKAGVPQPLVTGGNEGGAGGGGIGMTTYKGGDGCVAAYPYETVSPSGGGGGGDSADGQNAKIALSTAPYSKAATGGGGTTGVSGTNSSGGSWTYLGGLRGVGGGGGGNGFGQAAAKGGGRGSVVVRYVGPNA